MTDEKKRQTGKDRAEEKKSELQGKKLDDLTPSRSDQIKGGIPKQNDSGSGGGTP